MLNFKSYLVEGYQSTVLKHLEHPHHLHIQHGKQGFTAAKKFLNNTHHALTGKSHNLHISRKVDGGVSVIVGHDDKGVHVSTKSAFAKTPKINRSHSDIERHHGHAPGLVKTLKHVYDNAHKFVNKGHTVQGDLLYTKADAPKHKGGITHYTPNALPMHHEGKPKNVAIALHTHYKNGKAHAGVPSHMVKSHPDVHLHHTDFKPTPSKYTSQHRSQFQHHMAKAEEHHSKLGNHPHMNDVHKERMQTYLNQTVRDKSTPNVNDYKKHLHSLGQKAASKVKTDAAKQRHINNWKAHVDHVEKHKDHFANSFKVHDHLKHAKDALIKGHMHPSDEGLVVAHGKGKVKLVPSNVSHALLTNTRF